MEKIAIGPGYPDGLIDLDLKPQEAINRLAEAKGVKPRDISACILDRPRHARLIEAVRSTGASIRLIGDGDVAGIIHTTDPDATGIDIYLGSGGAAGGRAGGGCAPLHRRPDVRPAHPRHATRSAPAPSASACAIRRASTAPRTWRPATCSSPRPA